MLKGRIVFSLPSLYGVTQTNNLNVDQNSKQETKFGKSFLTLISKPAKERAALLKDEMLK